MRPTSDGHFSGSTRRAPWQGSSGRLYDLVQEDLASFSMHQTDLYVIAKGSNVLWVGATDDLVSDPASRARFRLAVACATNVLRLEAPDDRGGARWDLEGAKPLNQPVAQAA